MAATNDDAGVAPVYDQLLAVPTPYCTLSDQGEMEAAEARAESGRPTAEAQALPPFCAHPPTVFDDFDAESMNAISSQLKPWLEKRFPGLGIQWVETDEPRALRHAFQLLSFGPRGSSEGSSPPETEAQHRVALGWGDFRELRDFTAEIAATRGRQVMFFEAATLVPDSGGIFIPPALVRSIYPKLAFLPGSRFGDRILVEVPPGGSSPTDRSWDSYAHTTLRTFRDETTTSYCSSIRNLYEAGTVCAHPRTAAAFGLRPAVALDSSNGIRVGEELLSAVSVPPGRLYSSTEDETRWAGLIPAAELDVILATGKLALSIRNAPFVVWRLASALPALTWIQDGMIVAPCPDLPQYAAIKNLAHAASFEPEEGFTIYFLFAGREMPLLADVAARRRLPAARTAFCQIDDHRLPFALFVHTPAAPPDAEVAALVEEMVDLRAKAAAAETRAETPAEVNAKMAPAEVSAKMAPAEVSAKMAPAEVSAKMAPAVPV
jgi:hypothetical protein